MADPVVTSIAGNVSATALTTCNFSAQPADSLLVLMLTADDYTTTSGTGRPESTGWAKPPTGDINNPPGTSFFGCSLYYLKATGSETSVQYTLGATAKSAWSILSISNIDTVTPVNQSAKGNSNSSATNYTMAAVTTPTGSGRCVTIAACAASSSVSTPTSISAYTNSYTGAAFQSSTGPAEMIAPAYLVSDRGSAVAATNFTFAGGVTCQAGGGIVVIFNGAAAAAGIPNVNMAPQR